MVIEEDRNLQSVPDVSLFAFALRDCVVEIEPQCAKYLRAVHRTVLELAVPNLFGPHIGGYWLTPPQLEQLRLLPECYPPAEVQFVRRAVEKYLLAQFPAFTGSVLFTTNTRYKVKSEARISPNG